MLLIYLSFVYLVNYSMHLNMAMHKMGGVTDVS